LAHYFDAMFYISNWGSCKLMFRFPRQSFDLEQARPYIEPYIVEDFISFKINEEHVILKFEWHEEESEWGWVEGAGWLPRLLPLRDELLQGDYRLLYLAWLRAVTLEEGVLPEVQEPPLPPGLGQLSAALQAFIELFEVDDYLVAVAAQASRSPAEISEAELRQAIGQLSRERCDDWLVRLAQGTPYLGLAFKRALLQLIDRPDQEPPPRRTVGELFTLAERMGQEAAERQAAEAQARYLEKMEALAAREAKIWQEVFRLLEQKKVSAYQEAIPHLLDLRTLAKHQDREAAFQSRVNKISQDYSRCTGLLRRMREARLI